MTGDAIRRRRECLQCGHRFTTHERIEQRLPLVVKRDGRREPFTRSKVMTGLALACRKRPVDHEALESLVDRVETRIASGREGEITAGEVGAVVMEELRDVDAVAYVRFASVYHAFESIEQFVDALAPLRES
ncbi:MAG: transcriptional repressor NrdR [Myxococcota bacterium]|jgi:transcriptional repressor NrdR